MSESLDKQLLDAFVKMHGDHYQIKKQLGQGGSGTTYLANDVRRQIEVCVKIYRAARLDLVRRDWRITSTLKSEFLADTFTVESVIMEGMAEVTACISRYIHGVNLEKFLKSFDDLGSDMQCDMRPILMKEIALGLCDAVVFCHSKGYGHGDLSARNVIVTPLSWQESHLVGVVLIDFDNQSRQTIPSADETARKEGDVRALRRLIGSLTYGTVRHDAVQRLLDEATDAGTIRNALKAGLQLFGDSLQSLDRTCLPQDFWYNCLRDYILTAIVGQPYSSTLKVEIAALADELNCKSDFEEAEQHWNTRIENEGRHIIKPKGTGTFIKGTVREAIKEILNQ